MPQHPYTPPPSGNFAFPVKLPPRSRPPTRPEPRSPPVPPREATRHGRAHIRPIAPGTGPSRHLLSPLAQAVRILCRGRELDCWVCAA
ncbi:hypothetical protein H2248_012573 [Termitomyces sp. 'cryptogamus']|nr:hypothetical protein H2248_012573 [Termitomyces sp. 'cryptogamus']